MSYFKPWEDPKSAYVGAGDAAVAAGWAEAIVLLEIGV